MKGFIEVHMVTDFGTVRVLSPIDKITAIVETGDETFIETGFDGKGKSAGICATESYDTIKQKLINCEV